MDWILVGLAVLLLAGAGVGLYRVRRTIRSFLPTGSLIEALRAGQDKSQLEPRSLSGMESLIQPQVARDFPELNLDEMKDIVRRLIERTLDCDGDFAEAFETDAGDPVVHDARILARWWQSIRQMTPEVSRVHRVVVHRYLRTPSNCVLKFQAAFEYGDGQRKHQERCTVSFVYTRRDRQVTDAFTCRQCGAPVQTLGLKICSYCGALQDASPKMVWRLSEVVTD